MSRPDNQPLVAVSPEDLSVPADAASDILCRSQHGPLARARPYIGPLHLGLMALLHDVGRLPDPTRLRSSRDVAPLQHALADLESLQLAIPDLHNTLKLSPDAAADLNASLDAHWQRAAQLAAAGLSRPPGRPRKAPAPGPQVWPWLRHLLAFLSHRGLRVTGNGVLHRSDLRRFEAVCDLPPRQFLDDCLAIGQGLDLFVTLDERLIIGTDLDLLDLPPPDLSREILHRWIEGRIRLALQPVSSLGGLLGGFVEALGDTHNPLGGGATQLFRQGQGAEAILGASLGVMPIEPVSPFLTLTPGDFDLQSARVATLATHRRLRAGLLTLLAHLDRETPLPLNTIGRLAHAHIALDHLRRPTWAVATDGRQATVFATATQILGAFQRRFDEHLAPWFEALFVPNGLAQIRNDDAWILTAAPLPPIPQEGLIPGLLPDDGVFTIPGPLPSPTPVPTSRPGQGKLLVQNNGEVLAPPDLSVHALVHLACGAQPSSIDQVSTFTLNRRSLMRLSDAGIDIETWADMLERFSATPLPATVKQLISDVARQHGEFTLAPAGGVLIARDPVRLDELMSYPKIARQVVLRPAPNVIVLAQGCDLQLLLFELGDRGFSGIFVDKPDPQT